MTREEMPILRPVPADDPNPRTWEVMEDWSVGYLNGAIKIPKGFEFEASIPRFFHRIYSPTGRLFIASLVHDFCYRHAFYIFKDFNLEFKIKVSQEQSDNMFRELANEIYPTHRKKTWVAYKALRAVGHFAWNRNKELREAA